MEEIKIGDPVRHTKSRKEGIVKEITNGLADIVLSGEEFKKEGAEYTHLCLVENLVKL